jgi:hypothetical protein
LNGINLHALVKRIAAINGSGIYVKTGRSIIAIKKTTMPFIN